jgi:hypothetical protein
MDSFRFATCIIIHGFIVYTSSLLAIALEGCASALVYGLESWKERSRPQPLGSVRRGRTRVRFGTRRFGECLTVKRELYGGCCPVPRARGYRMDQVVAETKQVVDLISSRAALEKPRLISSCCATGNCSKDGEVQFCSVSARAPAN